jgi:hypothetical protein
MPSKSKPSQPRRNKLYGIPIGLLSVGATLMKTLLKHLREPEIVALAWVFSSPTDHPSVRISQFERHILASIGQSLRAALLWADAALRMPRKDPNATAIICSAKTLSKLLADSMRDNEASLRKRFPEIGEEIGRQVLETARIFQSWDSILVDKKTKAPKDPLRELERTIRKGVQQADSQNLQTLCDALKNAEGEVVAIRRANLSK